MEYRSVNTKLVVSELHRAFKIFNENLFDGVLPEPAILIQSRGNKKLTLGWCTVAKVWKNEMTHEERYEINIVAEALNRGVYPVMTTLLHEMVHLNNLINNVKDTSRGNTYHNMKFKNTAEEHGLIIEHAEKIGWSVSKLSGYTMDLIDRNNFNEAVFSLGRRDMEFDSIGKPRKKKKTSSRKYYCPKCGTSIRASKDVFILCGDCTDIEKGEVVPMIKVIEKDITEGNDEGTGTDAGTDADSDASAGTNIGTEVDVDADAGTNSEAEKVTVVCGSCGCVNDVTEGTEICPDCGESLAGTKEPEPVEQPEEPAEDSEIIEVDTTLIDGDGKEVEVKQGTFKATKTVWTVEQIQATMKLIAKAFEIKGYKPVGIDTIACPLEIEISEKLNSQYAKYVEGKKAVFSKGYLESASDEDIIDTINHTYLHHYQFCAEGLKVNHKKEFKALCVEFGISTVVPTKNHRAMK